MAVAADSVQMDSQALKRVERMFHEQIETGLHPGAALAVHRYGKPVLDLYDRIADNETGKTVDRDTFVVIYATAKPLAAARLHVLRERGKLDWVDPVARHWPEFAKNGKANITVRQIMTHESGFPQTQKQLS